MFPRRRFGRGWIEGDSFENPQVPKGGINGCRVACSFEGWNLVDRYCRPKEGTALRLAAKDRMLSSRDDYFRQPIDGNRGKELLNAIGLGRDSLGLVACRVWT